MILVVSILRFLILMASQEFLTTPSTKSISRKETVIGKIETQLGHGWQYKTLKVSYSTAFGGIQNKNSSGLTRDPSNCQSKVSEFMKLMLVWHRNLVVLAHTLILLIITLSESRRQDITTFS